MLFAAFAGCSYWLPKAFGFRLHEGWGKAAFWFGITGFVVVFGPMYVVGLLGMTRRMQTYGVASWHPRVLLAGVGIPFMAFGGPARSPNSWSASGAARSCAT